MFLHRNAFSKGTEISINLIITFIVVLGIAVTIVFIMRPDFLSVIGSKIGLKLSMP